MSDQYVPPQGLFGAAFAKTMSDVLQRDYVVINCGDRIIRLNLTSDIRKNLRAILSGENVPLTSLSVTTAQRVSPDDASGSTRSSGKDEDDEDEDKMPEDMPMLMSTPSLNRAHSGRQFVCATHPTPFATAAELRAHMASPLHSFNLKRLRSKRDILDMDTFKQYQSDPEFRELIHMRDAARAPVDTVRADSLKSANAASSAATASAAAATASTSTSAATATNAGRAGAKKKGVAFAESEDDSEDGDNNGHDDDDEDEGAGAADDESEDSDDDPYGKRKKKRAQQQKEKDNKKKKDKKEKAKAKATAATASQSSTGRKGGKGVSRKGAADDDDDDDDIDDHKSGRNADDDEDDGEVSGNWSESSANDSVRDDDDEEGGENGKEASKTSPAIVIQVPALTEQQIKALLAATAAASASTTSAGDKGDADAPGKASSKKLKKQQQKHKLAEMSRVVTAETATKAFTVTLWRSVTLPRVQHFPGNQAEAAAYMAAVTAAPKKQRWAIFLSMGTVYTH